MSVTLPTPTSDLAEQQVVLDGVGWDTYVTLNDSIGERKYPRMIYCEGRLTLVTRSSRRREWYAERLGEFVKAMTEGLDIPWEDAGSATYRREKKMAGAEGDKSFYIGANAELMKG